jgi:hypothetical protein
MKMTAAVPRRCPRALRLSLVWCLWWLTFACRVTDSFVVLRHRSNSQQLHHALARRRRTTTGWGRDHNSCPPAATALHMALDDSMKQRLEGIRRGYRALTERLGDPDVINDPNLLRKVSNEMGPSRSVFLQQASPTRSPFFSSLSYTLFSSVILVRTLRYRCCCLFFCFSGHVGPRPERGGDARL